MPLILENWKVGECNFINFNNQFYGMPKE